MTYELRPAPKPRRTPKRRVKRLHQSRMKRVNRKRKGRAFGAACVDQEFIDWIHTLPCAVHVAMGWIQRTPTEAEHFVHKSHGGRDKGDVYPGCGECREMRHGTMGPKAFTRMLQAQGFDERALCKKLVTMYESERWPCP